MNELGMNGILVIRKYCRGADFTKICCVRGTRTHPNFVPVSVYSQEISRFRRMKTADWPPLQVFSGALDLVVVHLVFVFVYSAERTSLIFDYC